jgi:hypothetical protein
VRFADLGECLPPHFFVTINIHHVVELKSWLFMQTGSPQITILHEQQSYAVSFLRERSKLIAVEILPGSATCELAGFLRHRCL